MSTLEDSDLLLVQRGDSKHKVTVENMSTIQDEDLLLVQRGAQKYKITGSEFKDNLGPPGSIVQPQIIAPVDGAGISKEVESSEITSLLQGNDVVWTSLPTQGQSNQAGWDACLGDPYNSNTYLTTDSYGGEVSFSKPITISSVRYFGEGIPVNGSGTFNKHITFIDADGSNNIEPTWSNANGATEQLGTWQSPRKIYGIRIGIRTSSTRTTGLLFDDVQLNDLGVTLGFADNQNFEGNPRFEPGDRITQNRSYTPVTSNITGIGDSPYIGFLPDNSNVNNYYDSIVNGILTATVSSLNTSAVAIQEGDPISNNVNPDGSVKNGKYAPNWDMSGTRVNFEPPLDTSSTNNINVYGGTYDNVSRTWSVTVVYSDGSSESKDTTTTSSSWFKFIAFDTEGKGVSSVTVTGTAYCIYGGVTLGDNKFITAAKSFELQSNKDLNNFRIGDVIPGEITVDNSDGPWYNAYTFNSRDAGFAELSGPFDLSTGDIINVYGNSGFIIDLSKLGETYSLTVDRVKNNKGTMAKLWLRDDNSQVTGAGGDSALSFTETSKPAAATKLFVYPGDSRDADISIVGTAQQILSPTVVGISQAGVGGSKNALVLNVGNFSIGETIVGPLLEPAVGTITTLDGATNTFTLTDVEDSFPQRFAVNASRTVLSQLKPSSDAAPSADGLTLRGSNFSASKESMQHTASDWQITTKSDFNFSSVVSESIDDSINLDTWIPSNITSSSEYMCHVKYKSNSISSEWSDVVLFKTAFSGKIAEFGVPYFDSNQQTVLSDNDVMLTYGIDPNKEPDAAATVGVFPFNNIKSYYLDDE